MRIEVQIEGPATGLANVIGCTRWWWFIRPAIGEQRGGGPRLIITGGFTLTERSARKRARLACIKHAGLKAAPLPIDVYVIDTGKEVTDVNDPEPKIRSPRPPSDRG